VAVQSDGARTSLCHVFGKLRVFTAVEWFVPGNRALISANLERLAALAAKHDRLLRLFRPKAGTMAIAEQRTSLTSTEFCERILEEERLFLIPGRPLGMSDRMLRFGLGMSDFVSGLERLDRFLKRLDSR
jgi:aspartate/methionine/tyrosine aminotransferase